MMLPFIPFLFLVLSPLSNSWNVTPKGTSRKTRNAIEPLTTTTSIEKDDTYQHEYGIWESAVRNANKYRGLKGNKSKHAKSTSKTSKSKKGKSKGKSTKYKSETTRTDTRQKSGSNAKKSHHNHEPNRNGDRPKSSPPTTPSQEIDMIDGFDVSFSPRPSSVTATRPPPGFNISDRSTFLPTSRQTKSPTSGPSSHPTNLSIVPTIRPSQFPTVTSVDDATSLPSTLTPKPSIRTTTSSPSVDSTPTANVVKPQTSTPTLVPRSTRNPTTTSSSSSDPTRSESSAVGDDIIIVKFSILLSQDNEIDAADFFNGKEQELSNAIIKSTTRVLCQDTIFIITTDDETTTTTTPPLQQQRDICWDLSYEGMKGAVTKLVHTKSHPDDDDHHHHHRLMQSATATGSAAIATLKATNGKTILIVDLDEALVNVVQTSSGMNPSLRWFELNIGYDVRSIGTKFNGYSRTPGTEPPLHMVERRAQLSIIQWITDGTFGMVLKAANPDILAVSTIGSEERIFGDMVRTDEYVVSTSNNVSNESFSTRSAADGIRNAGVILLVLLMLCSSVLCCLGRNRMKDREEDLRSCQKLELMNGGCLATEEGVSVLLHVSNHRLKVPLEDGKSMFECSWEEDRVGLRGVLI